jgi:hypothetical protein
MRLDFQYRDKNNNISHLRKATADYHVIGYHSDAANDPFTTVANPNATSNPTNQDRMDTCKMQLKDAASGDAPSWLSQLANNSRIICHASMYDVKFDRNNLDTPADHVPAQTAGQGLQDGHSISVGATPTDALLTYCRAHEGRDKGKMGDLEQDLLRIQTLLNEVEDDDVDGIQAAADEKYEQSFEKVDGGTAWLFKQQSDAGTEHKDASIDDVRNLITLNVAQEALNNLNREVAKKRWYLFAEWWNWVAGFYEQNSAGQYAGRVSTWVSRLSKLDQTKTALNKIRDSAQNALLKNTTEGTADRFFKRKDPTLLFGSIAKGWDADFTDNIRVRLSKQAMDVHGSSDEKSNIWKNAFAHFDRVAKVNKIPGALRESIGALLKEFVYLRSKNYDNTRSATAPQVVPWYHDENKRIFSKTDTHDETRHRDQWQATQPWRPIFVEWEALYYHIPWEHWTFKESPTYSNWLANVVHYSIGEDLSQHPEDLTDIRTLRGRSYLTPQAVSTLKTTLTQIFKNTNPAVLKNDYQMSESDQDYLLSIVDDLDIVSFPMTGLTSQLLTLVEGSHVKPLVQFANMTSVPILEAINAFKPITAGMDAGAIIQMMDVQTTLTPAGNLNPGLSTHPMKPVTHGQLMFTKLNIVDKFGQGECSTKLQLPF